MTKPDFTDDNAVAAYRAELRAVGRKPRLAGFLLVIAGVAGIWLAGEVDAYGRLFQTIAYGLLAAGWALMIAAIFMRTRYHRRRMREDF